MRVERDSPEILVGEWPPHPERTALLEARGALLAWDVLAGSAVPSARIHDVSRAADWLWEVYGQDAAAGILGSAGDVVSPVDGDWQVRDAARIVAHLGWVEAWWPAAADVPTIDPVLLRAERAVATSDVEHLLDDEEATERALAAVETTSDPALDARLVALAEDHGVELRAAVPTRAEFALAAGGGGGSSGVTVLSGVNTVDWALVPSGVVDAVADAEWAVVRREGGTYLEVVVTLVPGARSRLAARFGAVEVALDQVDDLGRLIGSVPVAPTILLLPSAQRQLTVYAPEFDGQDPFGPARQAAIIAYARSRPTTTLTERMAR
jgi:hypothetical protein